MSDKAKVLLVEDDPMVVRMYQRKLTMDGFELVLAFNGEEGLLAMTKERPDVVLLDVMMPKMDGFEMLRRAKADPALKDIPVVLLTNLGDRLEDVQSGKDLGANDYWVKANLPLNELSERISKIVSSKK